MNILYGVCGEGAGHSSRAKVIIDHLLKKAHKVWVVSYDRGYKNLKPFFNVSKITGPGFAYHRNKIDYIKTIAKNFKSAIQTSKNYQIVLGLIKKNNINLVISDFEPTSALAAKFKKLPLISLDNQHIFTNTYVDFPKKYTPDAVISRAVIDTMVSFADYYLVTTFFYPKIKTKNTILVPPIIRDEALKLKPQNKEYILVYFTSAFKNIIPILKNINKKFIFYGLNKNKKEKNIIFKKSGKAFLSDLANCEAVIANAGFSLISEALYLKKPYLALPVHGQFEQILNAYYLDKLGLGKYYDDLDQEKIEAFIYNLKKYQFNLKNCKSENNQKTFDMLDKLINKH